MSLEPSPTDRSQPTVGPSRRNRAAIRCLDLVGSSAGLILLSPLFVAIAIAVKATSPGPVLFRSARVGLDACPFTMFKFRSMRAGDVIRGSAITTAEDPRITRVGRLLRRLKLDELPQLFNVLKGEMSLVGPRPEDPAYVALYSTDQSAVLTVKPGMTSPASLKYRHEAELLTGADWEDLYVRQVMPAKLAIDLEYIRRMTVWSNLGVILRTIAGSRSDGGRSRRSPRTRT
jgi:lipopolysaccharide/colanic/teichoic acid biosynthesis glycosyltransferase